MSSLLKVPHLSLTRRCLINFEKKHLNKIRFISTSKKNSDPASAAAVCPPKNEDKNWVSYGFEFKDQKEDTDVHNASFFFSVTICLVFGSFYIAYAPDGHLKDWAQREAFLELRRREQAGLPPIDPNYVKPGSIRLPTEEQLKDVELTI